MKRSTSQALCMPILMPSSWRALAAPHCLACPGYHCLLALPPLQPALLCLHRVQLCEVACKCVRHFWVDMCKRRVLRHRLGHGSARRLPPGSKPARRRRWQSSSPPSACSGSSWS